MSSYQCVKQDSDGWRFEEALDEDSLRQFWHSAFMPQQLPTQGIRDSDSQLTIVSCLLSLICHGLQPDRWTPAAG